MSVLEAHMLLVRRRAAAESAIIISHQNPTKPTTWVHHCSDISVDNTTTMTFQYFEAYEYPNAHLLCLPFEILDQILTDLSTLTPSRLWQKNTPLQISAESPPSLSLLLTHSKLYAEATRHFYENRTITLHVNAYEAAKRAPLHTIYGQLLRECAHIPRIRRLELRPVLNASVQFLEPELREACLVLLQHATELKVVTIGWSEMPQIILGSWRPWSYKANALGPIKLLAGKVELVVGEAIMPLPQFKEREQAGLEKAFARLLAA